MALRLVRPTVARASITTATPEKKQVDPYYLSPEHQRWRQEVLLRARRRCEAINCKTAKRGAGGRLFADHIVEIKDGGSRLDVTNGQALCPRCHTLKTVAARAARMAKG
jgi:hypothetical protein